MPRWHTGRVLLLGDAAAAVSLLGQGASLGMAAASVLAEELDRHPGISSALTAFETRLRPMVEEHQRAGVSERSRGSSPATRCASFIRRTAVRLTKFPGMTRLISTAVAGKTGAKP